MLLLGTGAARAATLGPVRDINQTAQSALPSDLVRVGGTLFFVLDDGRHGQELWKSDGTAAGTVLVRDILAGYRSSYPADLVNVNGTLYFTATDGRHGWEVWRSDGTRNGTRLVKDIVRGNRRSSYPFELTAVARTLYFMADDHAHGWELWKSDGTAAGTVLVRDIRPGRAGSDPWDLTAVGRRLYFTAELVKLGRELWRSDGTTAGTFRVADINPGANGSDPLNFVVLQGEIYFSADHPDTGRELWKSNGTGAGTSLVADALPGPDSSAPTLGTGGDILFLNAFAPATGRELWAYAPCEMNPGDDDGDGRCDALDPCTNVAGSVLVSGRVAVENVDDPSGDESVLIRAILRTPASPPIDPSAKGLRVVLRDTFGANLLDETLPAVDWRQRRSSWLFRSSDSSHPIRSASLRNRSGDPARLRLALRGRDGHYPIAADRLPLHLTLVIDAPQATTGQCAELQFAEDACALSSTASTLRCRQRR